MNVLYKYKLQMANNQKSFSLTKGSIYLPKSQYLKSIKRRRSMEEKEKNWSSEREEECTYEYAIKTGHVQRHGTCVIASKKVLDGEKKLNNPFKSMYK